LVIEVVQAAPERGNFALDLQLSDNLFVEVFWARVCAHGDQVPTIDVFFLHASLSLGDSCDALPFQSSGLPLLFGLAALVRRFRLGA